MGMDFNSPVQQSQDQGRQMVSATPDDAAVADFQEQRAISLLQQISPENQIKELHWRLKGYIKDELTNTWKKLDENSPEPNSKLIARYIAFLHSAMSPNVTFSNYSVSEVNAILKKCIRWLHDDMSVNADSYGIGSDYTERDRVIHIILQNTSAVLRRAIGGKESQRVFKIMKLVETFGDNNKKSFTDTLKFWKK